MNISLNWVCSSARVSAASRLCSERSLALCYCVVLRVLQVVLVWLCTGCTYLRRQLIWRCATTVPHWTHSVNSVTAGIFLTPVWYLLCYIIMLLWKYRITVSFCCSVIPFIAMSLQHRMTIGSSCLIFHISGDRLLAYACRVSTYMQKEQWCTLVSPHWVCRYIHFKPLARQPLPSLCYCCAIISTRR